MKFIDDDTIEGEMSEAEFIGKVREYEVEYNKTLIATPMPDFSLKYRRETMSKDGSIEVYAEDFEYKGIPYKITINRHFAIDCELNNMLKYAFHGHGKIIYLYHPEDNDNLNDLLEAIGNLIGYPVDIYPYDNFLVESSLSNTLRNATVKEMVKYMHETAKRHINALEDMPEEFEKWLEKKKGDLPVFLKALKKMQY